jgi:hypothetical protein
VTIAEAEAAASPIDDHIFRTCFVCGPSRARGDGLRLFPGPVAARALIAAPFQPAAADCTDGALNPEIVWSLLDCPSGLVLYHLDVWKDRFVLGRMAARVDAPLPLRKRFVAVAKIVKVEGRKGYTASALFDDAGGLCAVARATWIRLAE